MSAIDWVVLFAALVAFVLYGVWRGRGERNLTDFLLAGRAMPWYMVGLSVMATQASAVTFLSTPGQGFADGLRFVQFYFGLPLAMIVVCVAMVPAFQRMRVFTAYEYLESRFDGKTRTLAAGLFLLQRGLAAGVTIYAPALVLSVLLGWDVRLVCILIGGLVVAYTAWGGSTSVGHTHFVQFLIILGTLAAAAALAWKAMPAGISAGDAAALAGRFGRLNALELKFDPNDRYNLWSGLIGGFFLQLSYFGTDQSQVGRYLTGHSITESRMGLIVNGLAKIPMQLAILSLGVLVFVFYLFTPPPLFFNPVETTRLASGPSASDYHALEQVHRVAVDERAQHVQAFLKARWARDRAGLEAADHAFEEDRRRFTELRNETTELIRRDQPDAQTNDTNYIFLTFVLHHLPVGLIGLVFAAIFAASMNSVSSEVNALTSTTVVDVVQRWAKGFGSEGRALWLSRGVTVLWAAFAVGFAEYASRLGSLIEAVNILGSLFYGTILGIFLTAFMLPRVSGTAVFIAAIVAEAVVIACFRLTGISFLWYNVIGAVVTMMVSVGLSGVLPRRALAANT
jgi:Na+/proline symporter